MATPEQQAERAAAWKARCKADDRWWKAIGDDVSYVYPSGCFVVDGMVYRPDGTAHKEAPSDPA